MPKSNNKRTCVRTTKILHWTPDNWNARSKGDTGEYLKVIPLKLFYYQMLENGLRDCHIVKVNFCYLWSCCLVNELQLRDVGLEFQETMC